MTKPGEKNQGVKLYIGTTATDETADTYQAIGRLTDFGELGPEKPIIDATALEDTARQKLTGIADVGDVDFEVNRVEGDVGQEAFKAAANSVTDAALNYKLVFNNQPSGGANPTTIYFKALATKAREQVGQVDGLRKLMGTLAVTSTLNEVLAA